MPSRLRFGLNAAPSFYILGRVSARFSLRKGGEDTLDETLATILAETHDGQASLIPVLQQVQDGLGYVPQEAICAISERLGVPASEVYGVVTFYAQFRLRPRGRNVVRVCRGTACHVRGSPTLMRTIGNHLGIRAGETTPDMEFTLEDIGCFGSCSLAPVMVINGDAYGRLTAEKALQLVESYRQNGHTP